jgi:hypothetical protein
MTFPDRKRDDDKTEVARCVSVKSDRLLRIQEEAELRLSNSCEVLLIAFSD